MPTVATGVRGVSGGARGGPGATATILLVEDEPAVRAVTARILRTLGYSVIEAAAPAEALALDPASLAAIELLVSDVVMPGMRGTSLADKLARGRPGLPALFISGYAPDAAMEVRLTQPGVAFLAKPFTPGELATSIRGLLDAVATVADGTT